MRTNRSASSGLYYLELYKLKAADLKFKLSNNQTPRT